jgi:acyl carrier protein
VDSRPAVLAVIQSVLADKGLRPDLADDSVTLDDTGLGLDSLDIATIAAELEEELEIDPFAHDEVHLGTLGEFVELYGDENGK